VTENSSLESPPQGINSKTDSNLAEESPEEFESFPQEVKSHCVDCGVRFEFNSELIAHKCPTPKDKIKIDNLIHEFESPHPPQVTGSGQTFPSQALEITRPKPPAEDIEFTALRNHIMDAGFVAAGVAFHIVALCSQPMTTPSTTTWDFEDRAVIPEMVFTLLRQPGYLEGIWPSLKVVMGSNIGNDIWCAGIATTIAFFDVIRTLPALEELKK